MVLVFSKDDWLQERIRDRAQRAEGFAEWSATHPLEADIWLAFCGYADLAFEAMLVRGDTQELRRCASCMAKLASWISIPPSGTQEEQEKWFQFLRNAGMPIEQAIDQASTPSKRAKGRPVSSRRPATLALEQKRQSPDRRWTWMELANNFCECTKPHHDSFCRDNLRQQVRLLEETLKRLGV